MTVRPILVYGDPLLTAPNAAVSSFDAGLRELVEDMFESGWKAPGLGLAAPQIGLNLDLATIDLSVGKEPAARVVLANPEIVHSEGKVSMEEGCLSFPGLFTSITRPRQVTVRAQNIEGQWHDIDGEGLLAQAICHEIDHLNGTLLVDHLRGLKRRMFLKRVRRMRELGVWERST